MATTLRHEFYETDEKLTLSIFDKGADPSQVSITFQDRKFTYTHGDKSLVLEPLKGQIDPDASDFTVGKIKIEARFVKRVLGRWGSLVGDSPDRKSCLASLSISYVAPAVPTETAATAAARQKRKNWEAITDDILTKEKEKSSEEDPNVGGDTALNSFFQKIFADADEDTKRAMMKSYQESGGTTLSTNWDEVKKGKVEVKPPQGAEWKNNLMSRLTIIVAATKANGIGVNARLPWRLPKEIKYFAQVTTQAPQGKQNAVIMGRNTWESIPKKFRPLPKRTNIVISRNPNYNLDATEGVVLQHNLQSALSLLDPTSSNNLHRGFIIGGATLYNESLELPLSETMPNVDRILLTRILQPDFAECDVFMPDFLKTGEQSEWKRASHDELSNWVGFDVPAGEQEENGIKYEFQMWVRK
ncbi:hypothetical protein CVT24_012370 [Panaeolus cyanescens]|uniref:Dihydrofolate reductase n=1 Tax=Panaeolus cyanescens TaxID=181874 RepID=A0A409YYM8_9AGAR|nr:hypothetical protein CVT24_012370 [Panaeolus cyanescens]